MGMLLNPVCVPMIRISIVGWMTLGQMPSFDHDSSGFIWKYAIPQFNTWSSLSPSFWAVLRYTTHFQTNECWPILMGQLQVLLELSETLLLWIVFLSWTSGHSSRSNNPRVVTSNNWDTANQNWGQNHPSWGELSKTDLFLLLSVNRLLRNGQQLPSDHQMFVTDLGFIVKAGLFYMFCSWLLVP